MSEFITNLNNDIAKIKRIERENIDEKYVIEYIRELCHNSQYIIANYRKPWRWDLEIDKEIRELLKNNDAFCIKGFDALDYYDFPQVKKKNYEQKISI